MSLQMTHVNCLIITFAMVLQETFSIWPPPYNLTLNDEETFEIFDPIDPEDLQEVYDEEMISKEDMRNLQVESDNDKYYRIHRSVNNDKENSWDIGEEPVKKREIFEEFNPDVEYPAPFKAGLVNAEGEFVNEDDVIYFDDRNEDVAGKKKREDQVSTEDNYDYNKLKEQFDNEVKQASVSNETVNYTNVKEDESIKDSIKTFLDIGKEPKNCTNEERKGIGLGAIECLWADFRKPKLRNHLLEKVIRIALIWFIVYLVIAIPLWCQYGWCCCCCRCAICRPLEQIEEVKRFCAQNPPGTYHDEDGNATKYEPTRFEKYAQKALEKQLRDM
ncbi:unnamed protein product [Phyllotreta striolata]|uniref:Uncharacterized protein n=1 Tax=Phyllotreta striolata TaxID=444603 RepID=A0A9N9TXV5_PHYSR|nr:unnamed protein product [Phyllotreta striolata]